MLIPTMTPEEIFAEIKKDAVFLLNRINKCAESYGKIVKRTTKFPNYNISLHRSKITSIQYTIVCYTYRRGEWDKPHCIIFTEYNHESGKTLIMLENDHFAIRIYTSHFISRFKERDSQAQKHLLNLHGTVLFAVFLLHNKEVREANFVKDFIKKNSPQDLKIFEHPSKFYQDEDYERIPMNCMDGLCLTERNKKNPDIMIYDTFISVELLRDEQRVDFLFNIPHLILNKMEYVYAKQKNIWGKEWEDLVSCIDKTHNFDEYQNMILDKLNEFDKRYPLPYI